jgi:hypothetical protein
VIAQEDHAAAASNRHTRFRINKSLKVEAEEKIKKQSKKPTLH